jgi:hypothetical protein
MTAFDALHGNAFAIACYDDNTIADLEAALAGEPDQADMDAWEIDADEWRAAIELGLAALRERKAERDAANALMNPSNDR